MATLPDIILLGPYGSGKGTQVAHLARLFPVVHVEVGRVLREEIRKGTPLGKRAAQHVQRGELVSGDDVMAIMRSAVAQAPPGHAIIFDGTPRNLAQRAAFTQLLAESGRTPLPLIINISREESLRRQLKRRVCSVNDQTIGDMFTADDCLAAGGQVVERPESDPTIAERRTQVYEEEILPVIEYYRRTDPRFMEVDGTRSVDEIHHEILQKLAPYVKD